MAEFASQATATRGTPTVSTILVGVEMILRKLDDGLNIRQPHALQEIESTADSTVVNDASKQESSIPLSRFIEKDVPDMYADVSAFHEKFKIAYHGRATFLTEEQNRFRNLRLDEELREYMEATTLQDKFDALIDLIYIALGNAHMHGFTRFNEGWQRVHEKNMEKEPCHSKNLGKYGKLGDGMDIVKPEGWTPPILIDLIVDTTPLT